ncbi:MAG: hypothetical protein CMI60_16950 [Parvibaculum sp.]|nr:hypothetical protein [Parvibaculum sp.]
MKKQLYLNLLILLLLLLVLRHQHRHQHRHNLSLLTLYRNLIFCKNLILQLIKINRVKNLILYNTQNNIKK